MSPCGMWVDSAHSHSIVKARVFSDSDEETWVRIYPARTTALRLPPWVWSGAPWFAFNRDFDGPGFHMPLRGNWRPKAYDAPPGQHWRGQLSWFTDGMPTSAMAVRPIVDTCAGPAIDSMGGVGMGGTSWPALRAMTLIDHAIVITATSGKQTIRSHVVDLSIVTTATSGFQDIKADVVDTATVEVTTTRSSSVTADVVDTQVVTLVVTPAPERFAAVIDTQVVTSVITPARPVGIAVVDQQTVDTKVVPAKPIKSQVVDQETITSVVTSPPFLTRAIVTFTQGSTASITIPGVTVNTGEMLFLAFSLSAPRSIAAAFWGTQAASVAGSDPNTRCVIFVWQLPGSGTHDITMSWSGGNADIAAIVRTWSGSPSPIHLDLAVQNSGTSSTAVSVSTGSATSHAVELIYYAGGITSPGSDPAPVWNAPLTTGLYENLTTCGISEAWYFTTATGVQTGSTTLANPHNWGAVVMTWFQ